MPPLTTSQNVLDLAKSKKIATKLKNVADRWKMEYIDMYDVWGALALSRDFLAQLSQLSSLVDSRTGREMLLDSKKKRGGGKPWAICDAIIAVSEAKALVKSQKSESTLRPRRVGDRLAHGEEQGSAVSDAPDVANIGRGSQGCVHDCRADLESITPQRMDASTNAEGISPARQSIRESLVDLHGNAADTLARLTESCVLPPLRDATVVKTPHATTDVRLPLTTMSSASLGATAIEEIFVPRSSPLKRRRLEVSDSRTVTDAAEVANVEEPQDLDEPAQISSMDYDRINVLLEAFNPNPSVWYIAPARSLSAESPDTVAWPGFTNAASLASVLLFPLYIISVARWTLAVFHRTQKRCLVFDAKGSKEVAEHSWEGVGSLLEEYGILQGESLVHLDPFPSIRQDDDVDCGIYVKIIALYTLHGKTVDRISARLWRGVLAGFFPTQGESAQNRTGRLLSDLAKPTPSESGHDIGVAQNMDDAEALGTTRTEVQSFAKQMRTLLAMIETQLQKEELRRKLTEMKAWASSIPDHADKVVAELVHCQEENATKQLTTLPALLSVCSRQLQLLKESCSVAVEECDKTALDLEKRRKNVIQVVTMKYQDLGRELAALCG